MNSNYQTKIRVSQMYVLLVRPTAIKVSRKTLEENEVRKKETTEAFKKFLKWNKIKKRQIILQPNTFHHHSPINGWINVVTLLRCSNVNLTLTCVSWGVPPGHLLKKYIYIIKYFIGLVLVLLKLELIADTYTCPLDLHLSSICICQL